MAPTSRGRGGKRKKTGQRRTPSSVTSAPDVCNCPACTGDGNELDQLAGGLVEMGRLLLDAEDPLEAEIAGAIFVAFDGMPGEELEPLFIDELLPRLESAASPEAVAILLAVASVAPDSVSTAATSVIDRLAAAGIPRPRWADEIAAPVTGGDFQRLHDAEGGASILGGSFQRAGRTHLFTVNVDLADCGAAVDIFAVPDEDLPNALAEIRNAAAGEGVELRTEQLDPEEFRWQVQNALDARAVHDLDVLASGGPGIDPEKILGPDEDEDDPGYPAMALLLRNRLAALPVPTRPPAPHSPEGEDDSGLAAVLSQLVGRKSHRSDPMTGLVGLTDLADLADLGGPPPAVTRRRASAVPLPPKRTRSAGPAPIYQLKVSLRGAQPPIWRRLEVPGNFSLARLHAVIQVAFGWNNSHLHVFETRYGRFGPAGGDLDHRAEQPVSLAQVLPKLKSSIRYTYDFGDDWDHEILLEKILDRDQDSHYPRCTGGRRAGPPEDCGGLWGYAELVKILGDPGHPEHAERLEWMGLRDSSEFDPAGFHPEAANKLLANIR